MLQINSSISLLDLPNKLYDLVEFLFQRVNKEKQYQLMRKPTTEIRKINDKLLRKNLQVIFAIHFWLKLRTERAKRTDDILAKLQASDDNNSKTRFKHFLQWVAQAQFRN